MKKILLSTFLFVAILSISKTSRAQSVQSEQTPTDYRTAVGLKFGGYENGPTVKYFVDNSVSLEGLLGFRSHGLVITGLYEFNQQAFGVAGLDFYYGAGAHIGSEGAGMYQSIGGNSQVYTTAHILLGVDGAIGLEYKIPTAPIALSLDLNPRAELATGPFFDLAPGLGIKYTF